MSFPLPVMAIPNLDTVPGPHPSRAIINTHCCMPSPPDLSLSSRASKRHDKYLVWMLWAAIPNLDARSIRVDAITHVNALCWILCPPDWPSLTLGRHCPYLLQVAHPASLNLDLSAIRGRLTLDSKAARRVLSKPDPPHHILAAARAWTSCRCCCGRLAEDSARGFGNVGRLLRRPLAAIGDDGCLDACNGRAGGDGRRLSRRHIHSGRNGS